MAILPKKEMLKIEEKIETNLIKQSFRPHLGASEIGDMCLRRVWLNFRWVIQKEIPAPKYRLFNRGHAEELIVAEDLINAGCKVTGINIDESISNRFSTVFKTKLPEQKQDSKKFAFGFGGASCDGLIFNLPDAPKTPHLFECKALNLKAIEKLRKYKLEKGNSKYFIQVQVYMHLFKLKRCLFIAVHKDTDERYYERIKYNKQVALKYIKIAETVILNFDIGFPRISDKSEMFPCSWDSAKTGNKGNCDFFFICHTDKLPIKNCRTCKHIGLRGDNENYDNSHFLCELKRKKLSYKKQVKGCDKYKLVPCLKK